VHFRELLSAFGPPENALGASHASLARVLPAEVARAVLADDREAGIARTLEWAARPNHRILTLADDDYPGQLLEIADPAPVLYVIGEVRLLSRQALAVVGSRNATAQGEANAEQFSAALSAAGWAIVSGLALGVDAAAHRGGLAGEGSTVAVMATGPDAIYPKKNVALAAEIARRGALVTEFALGTPPLAGHFPRRNRLISGLARGVLVVEAAIGSGSLITARLAAEQGRDVLAIPGSIHSPLSRGCHALIKQGAKLVESAEDVQEELRGLAPRRPAGGPARSPSASASTSNTSGVDDPLLQYMGYDAFDMDTLALRSGLTAEALSAMLLQLELEGKVARIPGGRYQRVT
jgi:DNA processing protein